jgi:hypothetical protein
MTDERPFVPAVWSEMLMNSLRNNTISQTFGPAIPDPNPEFIWKHYPTWLSAILAIPRRTFWLVWSGVQNFGLRRRWLFDGYEGVEVQDLAFRRKMKNPNYDPNYVAPTHLTTISIPRSTR